MLVKFPKFSTHKQNKMYAETKTNWCGTGDCWHQQKNKGLLEGETWYRAETAPPEAAQKSAANCADSATMQSQWLHAEKLVQNWWRCRTDERWWRGRQNRKQCTGLTTDKTRNPWQHRRWWQQMTADQEATAADVSRTGSDSSRWWQTKCLTGIPGVDKTGQMMAAIQQPASGSAGQKAMPADQEKWRERGGCRNPAQKNQKFTELCQK